MKKSKKNVSKNENSSHESRIPLVVVNNNSSAHSTRVCDPLQRPFPNPLANAAFSTPTTPCSQPPTRSIWANILCRKQSQTNFQNGSHGNLLHNQRFSLCRLNCRRIFWLMLAVVLLSLCRFLYQLLDGTTRNPSSHSHSSTPYHLSRSVWSRAHQKFSNQTYLDAHFAPFPWQQIRLPRTVRPILYDIFMWPNMSDFHNRGSVSIVLDLFPNVSTNQLVLHCKQLNITNVKVFKVSSNSLAGESSLDVNKFVTSPRLEQLYIETSSMLSFPHRYRVVIDFQRKLVFELEGFYISSYLNKRTRKKHYLLTTHFEPTAARSAFPCFDEPALKAKFAFRIRHDAHYQAFFNSPLFDRELIPMSDQIVSVFEQTVPMSTYLVAFVLCDFTVNQTSDSTGLIQIRTIVPESQSLHTQYALDFASKALDFYHNFFRVSYPLPKLDMVAVPDFGAGAMENWGMVTFRMTALIYNAKESSAEMKEIVGLVIAHELAHQWFGNLVTMNWWDELWLNEGFASYVENLGVDSVHPEWKMLDQFVISTSQPALALDALLTSHPIHATVKNPSEIEAIFDMISYKKGSCLIRMIEQFIGKQALQSGLQRYLTMYQFSTATTAQLWASLSEFSGSINVTDVMNSWINQAGFPLLTVKWNPSNDALIIRQRRFVSSLGPDDPHPKELWNVPVTVFHSAGTTDPKIHWMMGVEQITVPLNRSALEWFKLNHDQAAFYRVNYDTSIWREMIQRLVNTKADAHFLSMSDRAGLLDDAFALLRTGQLDVNTGLDLTRYLEFGETDYVPWETALNHFGVIDTIMNRNAQLQQYIVRLLRSLVGRLGWQESQNDSLFEIKLRAIILRAAIFYGHQESVNEARKRFDEWMFKGRHIAANIRESIYHAGLQFGGEREFEYVWSKYEAESDASEKRVLLHALSAIRERHLLERYLHTSLNQSMIRSQDIPLMIQCAARNPIGRNVTWHFVRNNWSNILANFGQGSFSLDIIIAESVWHFSTETEYNEVRDFFKNVELGSGQQSLQQSLEKIRANILWKTNVESKVMRWLSRVQPKVEAPKLPL